MVIDQAIPYAGLRRVFGIDVSDDGVIVVDATVFAGRISWKIRRMEDPFFQDLLRQERIPIAVCQLQRESLLRWVESPIATAWKARRILPSLLDVNLPFPLEECVYAFPLIRRVHGGAFKGLAVAARSVDIQQRLERLKQLGISPELVDQESLALWTQAVREFPDDKGRRVVVYHSSDRFTLVIGLGKNFIATHTMQRPKTDIVARFIRAAAGNEPKSTPLSWYWTGPLVKTSASLELQAELLHAIAGSKPEVREPASFLARALAFRALLSEPLRCNLRTGEMIHPRHVQRRLNRWTRIVVTALLISLVTVGVNVAWRRQAHLDNRHLQEKIAVHAASIVGRNLDREKGMEVQIAQREVTAREKMAEPFLQAIKPSILNDLQKVLRAAKELDVTVDTVGLEQKTASLRGSCADDAVLKRFVKSLQDLGYVSIKPEKIEGENEDGRLFFAINPVPQGGGK